MAKKKKVTKLYIAGPGGNGIGKGEGVYVLVSEEGETLYSHFCSSAGYAQDDLIGETYRPDRWKECKEKFGDFEVLFLGEDDMTNEELQKRYNNWYASIQESNEEE